MWILLIGLMLFLGVHSIRVFAEPLRGRLISQLGANSYKGLYTVLSLVGFALIIWGYGLTRTNPTDIWMPPASMRHVAALLTLVSFILLAAPYVRGNRIKATIGHPMAAGAKVWAFAHLLANGRLGDIVLFGVFLVWAILSFTSARRRDRLAPPAATQASTGIGADIITVVSGTAVWLVFALFLHGPLIGVRPFG